MDKEKIRKLLEDVQAGAVPVDEALSVLKALPYEDLGFAKIDTHRDLRAGFPEVIFCKGKTVEQLFEIATRFLAHHSFVMATKADERAYQALKKVQQDARYYQEAQIVVLGQSPMKKGDKSILVVSAGTSDLPIAEEAAVVAELMGNHVKRVYDIGVAGVHRLFDHKQQLAEANVIIVVAGMEGALASVVGGFVSCPVIAVPTSIGYGASFDGLAALLAMLNCCAPGVLVANIDNGFGAGYSASVINQLSLTDS